MPFACSPVDSALHTCMLRGQHSDAFCCATHFAVFRSAVCRRAERRVVPLVCALLLGTLSALGLIRCRLLLETATQLSCATSTGGVLANTLEHFNTCYALQTQRLHVCCRSLRGAESAFVPLLCFVDCCAQENKPEVLWNKPRPPRDRAQSAEASNASAAKTSDKKE